MESTSAGKRFRLRLSLKGLLGTTTFLAAVLGSMRRYNLEPIEKEVVIVWALFTAIGVILARGSLKGNLLAGMALGAAGCGLPAAFWYATRVSPSMASLVDNAGPILALALVGAIAGATVGLGAWLCRCPRRLLTVGVVAAAVGLMAYGWWSLAYWHPRRVLEIGQNPHAIVLSADGGVLAAGGETLQVWETASGRRLPGKFQQTITAHSPRFIQLDIVACDQRHLVAGRWGQSALQVLAIDDGCAINSISIPVSWVRYCRFIDSDTCAVGWQEAGHGNLGFWDTNTWQRKDLLTFPDGMSFVAISADLHTVATIESSGIRITRRGEPGSRLLNLPYGFRPQQPIFSPDGHWLAFNDYVWNLSTGKSRLCGQIVGFSADSEQLIQLEERRLGNWFFDLPENIRKAPLLPFIPPFNGQIQLTLSEISSGRIARQSPWLDGDVKATAQAEKAGLLALGVGKGRIQLWQIPDRH